MAIATTVAFLCVLFTATVAQRPTLNLFQSGLTEAQFFVPVETPEFFDLQLTTNPNVGNLVADPQGQLDRIEVMLEGGSGDSNIEFITVDSSGLEPDLQLSSEVQGQLYTYQLVGGTPTLANYSTLLSTLQYRSNLTVDAFLDPSRNISITAFDDVGSGSSLIAFITLLQDNQEAPQFDQSVAEYNSVTGNYEINVLENTANGAAVARIDASDSDGVRFSLSEPSTVFSIDPVSGDIVVIDTNALDYEVEENRVFQFVVVATDLYLIPARTLSSEATVVIQLVNTNDITPVFTGTPYVFTVVEEAAGAFVGQLEAVDGDEDGQLFFDFVQVNTGITFNLNRGTGEITVRTALDFEQQQSYSFDAVVSDGVFLDTTSVTVNVIDIADNRPVISPAEKTILLNLDTGNNIVYIGLNGTGGPLTVTDDSPVLSSGVASISVLRRGVCLYLVETRLNFVYQL